MKDSPALPDPSPAPRRGWHGHARVRATLNERMRTFLRLDFLYNQALHHNEHGTPWGSRAATASLIDILAITHPR